jgi:hypothetical protein
MERPAVELARAIQDAMVALFNLQTALINFFANKTSRGLIEAFQATRDILRADWEKYILFFQGCQGYSEDYISLCQYSATRKAPETLAFARDVLGMAKNLSREVSVLKTKHENALSDLGKHSKKLPAAFRKQGSLGSSGPYIAFQIVFILIKYTARRGCETRYLWNCTICSTGQCIPAARRRPSTQGVQRSADCH